LTGVCAARSDDADVLAERKVAVDHQRLVESASRQEIRRARDMI
jgi:hypothetical protein